MAGEKPPNHSQSGRWTSVDDDGELEHECKFGVLCSNALLPLDTGHEKRPYSLSYDVGFLEQLSQQLTLYLTSSPCYRQSICFLYFGHTSKMAIADGEAEVAYGLRGTLE